MFDKDSFLRLFYSVSVAAVITMIVLAATTDYSEAVLIIFKGMLAGAAIWFLGELLFPLCEKIYPGSVIPGYVLLILLISGGTAAFGYLLGVTSVPVLIKMCMAAEICGIGITVIYRRKYTKELNKKLEMNKNGLE